MTAATLAPGARVLIRDAEWVVRRKDRTSTGDLSILKARAAAGIAAQVKGAGAKPAPAPQAGKPLKPKKLTSKEIRELEALPTIINDLEMEKETLHLTLADPNYYRTAKDAVVKLTARLELLEQELAESYRRWEELVTVRGS